MEKLYYHPERKKLSNMPIFVDPNYYESLRYFVKLAEKIQPEIIKGIEAMIPLFSKTEVLHEKIKQDRSFVDDWSIIESCNEHRNSHLIELKNAIINWATKYNLYIENSSNTTFLEIALWAIPDRRDNEKDIAERKAFLERLGAKNVDFDEEWSISEVIYAEGEEEILKERISFDKIFPFVFTPSHVDIYGAFGSSKLKPLAADYEGLLSRYQLNILLAEAKTDEKIEIEDWFWGAGWDPRTATWNEFESVLDDAYKMYKKLYKERTKAYMKANGYVEGIQKRNKQHFIWLIMYQILQLSVPTIADLFSEQGIDLAEDTIRKGIASAAKSIDLILR